MDIEFKCKKCGQPLAVDEAQVGKEAKCPGCGTGFTVPSAGEVKAQVPVPSPEEAKARAAPPSAGVGTSPSGRKTSGLAIASLVLGILGFCTTITAIPGLILGIVGLQRVKRSGGTLTGEGMAIAGIVISAIALVLVPIQAAMLLPALARARESARRAVCMSNLKQVGLGCVMWAVDHDEQYPSSLKDLYPDYVGDSLNVFVCPSTADEVTGAEEIDEKGSYIYVSGLSESSPVDTVVAYDREENHGGEGRNVLFVDGHVEWVREGEFSELLNRSP